METAFKVRQRKENSPLHVLILNKTQNLIIWCSYFAEDGKKYENG